MADLDKVADQGTPLLRDLGTAAPQMDRLIKGLGHLLRGGQRELPEPRRRARARPAGADPRAAADPAARRARRARPSPRSSDLDKLTASLKDTQGIQRINDFLYYLTLSTNGYDSLGHYLRAGLVATTTCSNRAVAPAPHGQLLGALLRPGGGGSSASPRPSAAATARRRAGHRHAAAQAAPCSRA